VANGDKPWEKYGGTSAAPWLKYQTAPSMPSPITDKSTIGPSKQQSFDPESKVQASGFKPPDIEHYTQKGREEHPFLSRLGDVISSGRELLTGGRSADKPMGTKSGVLDNPVTTAISMAPGAAEGAAALSSKIKGLGAKVDPLARINKILGVKPADVRVGTVPETLDEFAANPARGVLKAGLEEKQLAKMNPLERTKAVTTARESAGAKLDQVLQAHPDKTINVQKTVQEVFSQIDDKKLIKMATARMQRIVNEAGITKPLSQLTPMEARTIQRGLDEFANFAPEGTAKTFRDVATALRRGISKATRQAIPETAELDQDYGDLAKATKAVRRQVAKYASEVSESKLRKIVKASAGLAGLGGAYEIGKHFASGPLP
jgi:hypothetical protein